MLQLLQLGDNKVGWKIKCAGTIGNRYEPVKNYSVHYTVQAVGWGLVEGLQCLWGPSLMRAWEHSTLRVLWLEPPMATVGLCSLKFYSFFVHWRSICFETDACMQLLLCCSYCYWTVVILIQLLFSMIIASLQTYGIWSGQTFKRAQPTFPTHFPVLHHSSSTFLTQNQDSPRSSYVSYLVA